MALHNTYSLQTHIFFMEQFEVSFARDVGWSQCLDITCLFLKKANSPKNAKEIRVIYKNFKKVNVIQNMQVTFGASHTVNMTNRTY